MPEITDYHRDLFLEKIAFTANPEKCWNWTAHKIDGYGRFRVKDDVFLSNRLAYYIFNGVDPMGLLVCHTCDNRACCNPKHFFLGTGKDNFIDMVKKGRTGKGFEAREGRVIKAESRQYGERNVNAKMSAEMVVKMRLIHSNGGVSYADIGKMFGITTANACYIVKRVTWKHIL